MAYSSDHADDASRWQDDLETPSSSCSLPAIQHSHPSDSFRYWQRLSLNTWSHWLELPRAHPCSSTPYSMETNCILLIRLDRSDQHHFGSDVLASSWILLFTVSMTPSWWSTAGTQSASFYDLCHGRDRIPSEIMYWCWCQTSQISDWRAAIWVCQPMLRVSPYWEGTHGVQEWMLETWVSPFCDPSAYWDRNHTPSWITRAYDILRMVRYGRSWQALVLEWQFHRTWYKSRNVTLPIDAGTQSSEADDSDSACTCV